MCSAITPADTWTTASGYANAVIPRWVASLRRHTTYLRMYAKVLAAREPKTVETAFLLSLFVSLCNRNPVLHEALQLCQSLFDFGDGSGTIDELAFCRVVLTTIEIW